MAQGSGVTVHLKAQAVPYHEEAYEMADMGFVPAGAYRNRDFAEAGVRVVGAVARALQDIFTTRRRAEACCVLFLRRRQRLVWQSCGLLLRARGLSAM